jgi:DNA adenine methylase
MKVPHPIPYQGSKRNLARQILSLFPMNTKVLFEPFAGSAAISIAAALKKKCSRFHLNDINKPLMGLWNSIINEPEQLAKQYTKLWRAQTGNEREFYDRIREKFNRTSRPDFLLYLLARCVKAAVRYNFDGEFNQSPDNRRRGRHPSMMKNDILATSALLKERCILTNLDYKQILTMATEDDLIYMDPPYQGTFANGGFRYYGDIELADFIASLERINAKKIPFILSYDGRTGDKTFGECLPSHLELAKIEVDAGRSSQATLLGRNHITYESVYLSKALVQKLNFNIANIERNFKGSSKNQISLFEFEGI